LTEKEELIIMPIKVPKYLMVKFDRYWKVANHKNRSDAIRKLMKQCVDIEKER